MVRPVVSRQIAARAQSVRSHLASVLAWSRWLPTVSAVETVLGHTLEVGAAFGVIQPRLRPRTWTVTDLQPGRRFTWESSSPWSSLRATHAITPAASRRLTPGWADEDHGRQ